MTATKHAMRRETGTATNSRLWNWLGVPALPTVRTPGLAAKEALHA